MKIRITLMVRLPKPKKIKLLNGRIFLAKYKLEKK